MMTSSAPSSVLADVKSLLGILAEVGDPQQLHAAIEDIESRRVAADDRLRAAEAAERALVERERSIAVQADALASRAAAAEAAEAKADEARLAAAATGAELDARAADLEHHERAQSDVAATRERAADAREKLIAKRAAKLDECEGVSFQFAAEQGVRSADLDSREAALETRLAKLRALAEG